MSKAKETALEEIWHAIADLMTSKEDLYESALGKGAQRSELEEESNYLYKWLLWVEAELKTIRED